MKALNLVFVPQEFSSANHQGLWRAIAAESGEETVVVNIGADLAVSVLKRRFFRIREAFQPPVHVGNNLDVIRPLYLVRPEVACGSFNRLNMRMLRNSLVKVVPDLESRVVRAIIYNGAWASRIRQILPSAELYYYVMDEVTRVASTDGMNRRRTLEDREGCMQALRIFLMSDTLVAPRKEFFSKLVVVGNGADLPIHEIGEVAREPATVGIVGNIRNWIDRDLLDQLIALRPDLQFILVGNVEADMRPYVSKISRENQNVSHVGPVPKTDVWGWYRKVGAVIVPYKQNSFMRATRPIKIVESIFAGTPVVSVPVGGYLEASFLRFAHNAEEFSEALSDLLRSGIDTDSVEYSQFVEANTWSSIARRMLAEMGSEHYARRSA